MNLKCPSIYDEFVSKSSGFMCNVRIMLKTRVCKFRAPIGIHAEVIVPTIRWEHTGQFQCIASIRIHTEVEIPTVRWHKWFQQIALHNNCWAFGGSIHVHWLQWCWPCKQVQVGTWRRLYWGKASFIVGVWSQKVGRLIQWTGCWHQLMSQACQIFPTLGRYSTNFYEETKA